MKIYYRISDNSYCKPKIPGATKLFCLENAMDELNAKFILIADNCNNPNLYKKTGVTVIETALGNAGSFLFAMRKALEEPPDEIIYFLEDDYIHRPFHQSSKIITEGLEKSDYITLYDHPDKYESEYNYGEECSVFKTNNSHWRTTISTTMTFAAKAKTIKEDFEIFEPFLQGNHPSDHEIFIALGKQKRTRNNAILSVCIPGIACHTDLTYSQQKNKLLIDSWIFHYIEKEFLTKMSWNDRERIIEIIRDFDPIQRLAIIENISTLPSSND